METRDDLFRVNQAIAKAGLCSRRDADKLIASGRVRLNGKIVRDFAATVNPQEDMLEVDGRKVQLRSFVYVAMYKPRGVVTTCSDEFRRKTVLELLPERLRHLRPVGRLDMDSEGLLIFTNDGTLTQRITHPYHHLPKRYIVTVKGNMAEKDLNLMSSGIVLSDGRTSPARVRILRWDHEDSTFELTIHEGKNRQIRRMCAQLGYHVKRLVRVAIGRLQLGQMTPGSWRYLTGAEMKELGSE